MDLTKMDREEAIDWIIREWAIHSDGNGQNAHLLATEFNAGFATPEIVRGAKGQYIIDNDLGKKYPDMADIPCGKYWTKWAWGDNDMYGVNEASFIKLHVYAATSYYKLYVVISGYYGDIYYKNIHTTPNETTNHDGYNPQGWRKLVTEKLLFEGNVSAPGSTIQLNDEIRYYKYLELRVDGDGGQVFKVPVLSKMYFQGLNLSDGDSPTTYFWEIELNQQGTNKLTIKRNDQTYINNSGLQGKSTGALAIVSIKGLN
ncbi:hypothetical protein EM4838_08220 [Enterococcus mundtii]|uniref:Uncharacterized protein n=1 Tax=Enterococcus mundtii TaxID=53346 RepID=A0ABQ0VGH7_ENTMU|nr:hypothetical protein [Enterococcus mundtii]AUB52980.1 hypothetical protein EM4838_08220 [Enterococcus mundtii]OJG57014.1 hypothetical protein RV08_GL002249 [Enterococcus mundtii]GEL81813.1 hypothetical protein EMU01_29570 [Enterococcus mundtii]GEN20764.1 hypothetical protein LAC02_40450 [Ligilactobacillus acidipiscis]